MLLSLRRNDPILVDPRGHFSTGRQDTKAACIRQHVCAPVLHQLCGLVQDGPSLLLRCDHHHGLTRCLAPSQTRLVQGFAFDPHEVIEKLSDPLPNLFQAVTLTSFDLRHQSLNFATKLQPQINENAYLLLFAAFLL